MSGTVEKHSRELQRAVRWVSEQRQQNPDTPLATLLSQAGPKFNLSPRDQEGLFLLLSAGKKD